MNEAACKSDASALLCGALVIARGGQSRDAAAWQRRERSCRDAQLVAWSHIGLAALLCCSNAVGRLHVKEAACQKRCMRTALRRACDNTWRSEHRCGRVAAQRGS